MFVIGVPTFKLVEWKHLGLPSSVYELILHLFVIPILYIQAVDTVGWTYHWFAHRVRFLRRMHGEHHASYNPCSFSESNASDWIEWIITTVIGLYPVVLGRYTYYWPNPTIISFLVFVTWSGLAVVFNHSGKITPKISFLISSVEHWAHHRALRSPNQSPINLGEYTTLMDRIFGTYVSQSDILEWKDREEERYNRKIQLRNITDSGKNNNNEIERYNSNEWRSIPIRIPGGYGLIQFVYITYKFLSLDMNEFFVWFRSWTNQVEGVPLRWIFMDGTECILITNPEHTNVIFKGAEGNDPREWTFSRGSWEFFLARFRKYVPDNIIVARDPKILSNDKKKTRILDVKTEGNGNNETDLREVQVSSYYSVHSVSPDPTTDWKIMRTNIMKWMKGPYLEETTQYMREVMVNYTLPQWREIAKQNVGKSFIYMTAVDLRPSILEFSSIVAFHWVLRVKRTEIPTEVHQLLTDWFDSVRALVMAKLPIPEFIETEERRKYRIRTQKMDDWLIKNTLSAVINHPDSQAAYIIREYTKETDIDTNTQGHIDWKRACGRLRAMLVGGSETTLIAIQRGLHELAVAQDEQTKLAVSLMNSPILEDGLPMLDPDHDSLLARVVQEIMRLGHPAYVFTREALKDVMLDVYRIKKNSVIWGSQYITHRMRSVWGPNPNMFVSDRWKKENVTEQQKDALLTFIFGPRACPGAIFARRETSIVLASLLREFKIELPIGASREMKYDLGLTMRPANPVLVVLTPRNI